MIAGVLTYYGVGLMEALKIDDPVGAFPVHGLNGIFGTLAIGLFATRGRPVLRRRRRPARHAGAGRGRGHGLRLPGVAADVRTTIKAVFGLRVPAEVERAGIDGFYHGMTSYPEFTTGYSMPSHQLSKSDAPRRAT